MDNREQLPPKKNNLKRNLWFVVALALIFLFIYYISSANSKIETISYTEFQQKVEGTDAEGERVAKVYTRGATIYVLLEDSKIKDKEFPKKADYKVSFINSTNLIEYIDKYNSGSLPSQLVSGVATPPEKTIDVKYNLAQEPFLSKALPYLSLLLFIVLGYFIMRSLMGASGKNMGFGKTKAILGESIKIKFSDVAGSEEEKEEMQEIVEFLKNPQKFTRLGARIPKGVLLVGPPGTGKTLLAKAIAGESHVQFYSISGSDFVEMFVGVGASRVRDLFEQAKKNAPCLIFIDEIDAVGRQRGTGMGGGNDEREQTLNQLLVQMDGFDGRQGIIVIAATNRPDILDPALLRAGRFDRQIVVNIPDIGGREKILKVHSRTKPLSNDVDLKIVAKNTVGFTGADLENLMNEAAILAVRADRESITMEDINNAVFKVLMGPQKKSSIKTAEDNEITAYHEAGHAIVSYVLDKTSKIHEVSIIERGRAAGYTATRPESDSRSLKYSHLCNDIAMASGGRIAEDLIFHDVTVGASNDIQVLTERARKMVTEWGMSSRIGPMNVGGSNEVFLGRDYQNRAVYSEATAAIIDEEVKKLIEANYARAVKVLEDNIDKLHTMAKVLLEVETIYTEDVERIMNGATIEEVVGAITVKREEQRKKDEQAKFEREEQSKRVILSMQVRANKALVEAGVMSKEDADAMLAKTKKEMGLPEDFNFDELSNNLAVTENSDKENKNVDKENATNVENIELDNGVTNNKENSTKDAENDTKNEDNNINSVENGVEQEEDKKKKNEEGEK